MPGILLVGIANFVTAIKTEEDLADVLLMLFTYTPPAPPERAEDQYVKVDVQGILQTAIVAIGGETTGTVIKIQFQGDVKVTWELDLGNKAEFEALAKKLNGKAVRVTGSYSKKVGVEIPQGQRSLTLCARKDLCHEIKIPAATSAFHGDAFSAGMLLKQR